MIDFSQFVSRQPTEIYQGGAGAGMRQLNEQRSRERMQMAELGLRTQQLQLGEKNRQQEYERDLFKRWGAAVMAGDRDNLEIVAQELAQAGFDVQRPDTPEAVAPEVSTSEPSPFTGHRVDPSAFTGHKPSVVDPSAGTPSTSTPDIDGFFRAKAGKGKLPADPATRGPAAAVETAATSVAPSPEQQEAFEAELLSGAKPAELDPFTGLPQPRRSAGWIVKRPDGAIAAQFDEHQVKSERKAHIARVFTPLIEQAQDEISRSAALKGAQYAMTLSDTEGVSAAIAEGQKVYQYEVGPRHARIAGGASVMGKNGPTGGTMAEKRLDLASDFNEARYVRSVLNNEQMNQGMKQLTQLKDKAEKSSELATSANSLAQLGAKTELLKAFFSSVTSDRELATFEGAGGRANQLQTELNKWIAEGKQPPGFMRKVAELANLTRNFADIKMQERGLHARKVIENDPMLRERVPPQRLKQWGDLAQSTWMSGGGVVEGAQQKEGAATDDDVADLF